MNMLEALITSKMSGGSGSGSGGGDKVLNSDGIIKQEHLPEGYPYEGEGYVLPETALSNPEETGEFVVFDPINLTVGETYTVNWNGTDYSCETIAFDMNGVPAILFGDTGAFDGEPSGSHPFAALVFPADMIAAIGAGAAFMPLDGSTTATVSIKGNILKKIDKKFLPFSVALIKYDYNDKIYSPVNMTYEEAVADIESNTPLLVFVLAGGIGLGYSCVESFAYYTGEQIMIVFDNGLNIASRNVLYWTADGISDPQPE